MSTRRQFLAAAACSLAATRFRAQGQGKIKVGLAIPTETTGPHMPVDFVGLSYEVQQLTDPNFFSAAEQGPDPRVQSALFAWCFAAGRQHERVRLLETHARFSGTRASSRARGRGRTEASVLRRDGGLGAQLGGVPGSDGTGRASTASEWAPIRPPVPLRKPILWPRRWASRLQYFQIGNEVDLFGSHLRDPKTWNAKDYLEEWLTLRERCSRSRAGGASSACRTWRAILHG